MMWGDSTPIPSGISATKLVAVTIIASIVPKTRLSSSSSLVVAALFLIMGAGVARDYRTDFRKAMNAYERGRWADAAEGLRQAIAENNIESSERIIIYETRYRPYIPHFYRGVALARLGGRCDEVRLELTQSEEQGAIKKLAAEYATLRQTRNACEPPPTVISATATASSTEKQPAVERPTPVTETHGPQPVPPSTTTVPTTTGTPISPGLPPVKVPLRITRVEPAAAGPGETVTIYLSKKVSGVLVRFGAHTMLRGVGGESTSVKVPDNLKAGDTPTIEVVDTGTGEAARYFAFRVTAPSGPGTVLTRTDVDKPPGQVANPLKPLSILRIEPFAAEPGQTIVLVLSRPLQPDASTLLYYFPGGTTIVNPMHDRSRASALIPTNMPPGFADLVLEEASKETTLAATAPYRFQILEPTTFGIRRTWAFAILAILMVSLAPWIAIVVYRRRRLVTTRRRAQELELLRSFDAPQPSGEALPIARPKVPQELAAACASGRCILFAGPGLGAQAGLPTRAQAIAFLVNTLVSDETLKSQLNDALRTGQFGSVTDVLIRRIRRELIAEALQPIYADVDLSAAHKSLRSLPFSSVLTTGWDGLVEKTFEHHSVLTTGRDGLIELTFEHQKPEVVTSETNFGAIRSDRFFVARLYGDLFQEESFIFSSREYRQALSTRPAYARFISSHLSGHPLFFVGMSLTGIEELFDALPSRVSIDRSYAILPYTPLWEEQRQRVREEYGVELIGYPQDDTHSAVGGFLRELEQAVGERATTTAPESADGKLYRVQITNIGPFASLTLDELQPGWNVLLGNNGSGKSTVLRAIALALCGDDPEAALLAAPLLRENESSGRIDVTIGNVTYTTKLYRDGERVKVDAGQSPLRSGKWVALGFPALRGVSQRDPSGASLLPPSAPGVRDVLPLIRGTIDTRLDSLKQWLVNLDFLSTPAGNISRDVAKRNERTTDAFYMLLRHFMPDQPVEKSHVDRRTFKVYVKTQDPDPVPIEKLSQGMSSIFGWIGTVIQRLFEIYPDAEAPKNESEGIQQPALILVDEIDAHLHPEWQRKLRSIVSKYLPNVQVIASTHSPLLVVGMKQEQLLIARRNPAEPSRIDVFRSPIDPEGLRADQVLTSPLFGLESARDPDVEKKLDDYVKLLGNRHRNEREECDFVALKETLTTILMSGETDLDRVAEQQSSEERAKRSADLAAAVATASEEMKEKLRREL